MKLAPTSLFLACMLAAPLPATAQVDTDRTQASQSVELHLERYRVDHADPGDLFKAIHEFHARLVLVPGINGAHDQQRQNLHLFHDTILIYDKEERVKEILHMLALLDEEASEREESQPISVNEYAPRYLSLESIYEALRPFHRQVLTSEGQYIDNIGFITGKGSIVMRDSQNNMRDMLSFLEKIDVASPQVMISCFLVRGTQEQPAENHGAPENLSKVMTEFLGTPHLEVVAHSMLRSSVRAGTAQSIILSPRDSHVNYELSVTSAAYEPVTRALSLSNCSLELMTQPGVQGRQLFRTATTLQSDEYTVLGATGMDPLYLVIRVQPLTK